MLLRVVLLFLLAMGVLVWLGRFRLPGGRGRLGRRGGARLGSAGRCRHCGAPIVGKGPCPCGRS